MAAFRNRLLKEGSYAYVWLVATATNKMMRLHNATSFSWRTGLVSPAVLHNELKCEGLGRLAQLRRTPLLGAR